MALSKVTPTHKAIMTLENTIKALKLQLDALYATLPDEKKEPVKKTGKLVHPITGKVSYYKVKGRV